MVKKSGTSKLYRFEYLGVFYIWTIKSNAGLNDVYINSLIKDLKLWSSDMIKLSLVSYI